MIFLEFKVSVRERNLDLRSVTGREDPREDTVVLIFRFNVGLGIGITTVQYSVNLLLFMLPLLVGHRKGGGIRCRALEKLRMRFGCRIAFAFLLDFQLAFYSIA